VLHGNGCVRGKVISFCENQYVPAARTLGLKQSICFAVAACKPPKSLAVPTATGRENQKIHDIKKPATKKLQASQVTPMKIIEANLAKQ
jgi:hypothetical protein